MTNKAKEKRNKKSTKEKDLLDLDNEIIIGIKSLPSSNDKKKRKVTDKKKSSKKTSGKKNNNLSKTKKKSGVTNKNTNKSSKKIVEEGFELNLGIEDETVKEQSNKKTKHKEKVTQKQQEIAKKKRRIIFRFVKWTSLLILLIGGGIYFLLSPFFNIKSITIIGNEKIATDEIVSLSGIQLEENIFKVSSSKVEQAIKTNAYIESVQIKRKLPETIEIQIIEREPSYILTLGNAYIYMNTQGYLLEISKEPLKLPVITGFLTPEEQIQEGNRLCAEDLQRLSSVIQIVDSANNNEIRKLITKIDISDKQDYVLELKSEKKNIHIGDTSNLSTKMLYVKTILEKEKKKEGDIYVNTDLSNKGAIFREKV